MSTYMTLEEYTATLKVGYYGHDVLLVSKYDDKIVIEADDVL